MTKVIWTRPCKMMRYILKQTCVHVYMWILRQDAALHNFGQPPSTQVATQVALQPATKTRRLHCNLQPFMSCFRACGPKIKQKGAAGCIATCNLKPCRLQCNLKGNLQRDHQHGLATRTKCEYMRQGTHSKQAALKHETQTISLNTNCRTALINVRRAR